MPYTHKKKSRKMHGNRTRGYGTIGGHRAKGVRGGTGLTAGKFKYKWSYYMKMKKLGFPGPDGDKWRIGHKGFIRPPEMLRIGKITPINIKDLEINLDDWVNTGKIKQEGNKYIIDLNALKFNKLLGKGKATKEMDITVRRASGRAIEKIKAAKGSITLTEEKE
ncbi:MAG: uL15m family ribosomal protein [Promethearchaeota archaeon]